MSGTVPLNFAITSSPRIESSKLTANDSNVSRKVTNRTRAGIAYQRGFRGFDGLCISFRLHLAVRRMHRVGCVTMTFMSQASPALTRTPAEVVRLNPVSQAANGICYASTGEVTITESDLERMIAAVPRAAAATLERKAYYFVPLTVSQGDDTVIADRYDVVLSDRAVCHRNLNLGDAQCVFISTRLMDDKFSVAFEFYINVGHAIVEKIGVSQAFADLCWKQVDASARGETSLDAWDARKGATTTGPDAEKYKNEYFAAAFSDAISIYLLSLYLDVDYYDLRERDYPLLAPTAMAERLRKIAELFPPNPGFDFAIYYKRRS